MMCTCLPWRTLSLCLIISISVATQEDSHCKKSYEHLQNFSQLCEELDPDHLTVSVFLRNEDGLMQHNASVHIPNKHTDTPDASYECIGHPPLDISCVVDMHNHLNFSWDARAFPEHARYSISYLICDDDEAVFESSEERVYTPVYHTLINHEPEREVSLKYYYIILRINVSYPDLWYIQTQKWDIHHIAKLDPPRIINATFHGDDLYLQWDLPRSTTETTNPDCFMYELRINDEVKAFDSTLSYTERNIDPTRQYDVQMRVKVSDYCSDSELWSDWTSLSLVPEGNAYPSYRPGTSTLGIPNFHIGVIIAIALGLPMILLAMLLLCKFQRVLDKLFPPVPGPSMKIKGLLERDFVTQIMPQKYVEEESEVHFRETLESEEEDEEEEKW